MPATASVSEIYRRSKKRQDNFWTEWISRPPAAVLVWLLAPTTVTPNQVTFASLAVFGGAVAVLVGWPTWIGLLLAAALVQLSYILDCTDGQLARLKSQSSPVGALLDFLMDEIKAFLLIGGAAARQWRSTGEVWWLLVGLGGLAAAASGIALTTFMRRPEYLAATGAAPGPAPTPAPESPAPSPAPRRSPVGHVVAAVEWIGRLALHYPSWLWIAAVADRLDVFLWIYLGAHALYLGRSGLIVLVKLGRPIRAAAAGKR